MSYKWQIGSRNGSGHHASRLKLPWPRLGRVFLIGTALLFPKFAWSQATKPEPQLSLNVGAAMTLAGDTVDIPLLLSGPETVKVLSVIETISFPKRFVSFTKAVVGLAGEEAQAEVKTNITEDRSDPSLSLFQITISSKHPMKLGVLAYLKLKVSTEARKGTIALKEVDVKGTSENGEPLQMAKGKDGAIGVYDTTEEMPVTGCFFFNH